MKYEISQLLTTNAQSIKTKDNRYVKAYLDNGIYIILVTEYYSDNSYKLLGYFDSRNEMMYVQRDYDEYDYTGKISSLSSLREEYKEAFTDIVNVFIKRNEVELLTKGKPVGWMDDVKSIYIKDNLNDYLQEFDYKNYTWYEVLHDVGDLTTGVLLDYLMNPKETLDRETLSFLKDSKVLVSLANMVTRNHLLIDNYHTILNMQDATVVEGDIKFLNLVKKIYQALETVENKTVRVYFTEDDKPFTVEVEYLLRGFDNPKCTLYLGNGKFAGFEEILKITSGRKTIYQKEISSEEVL